MHRLIVALLATVDAAIAVAVGIAATLAPLTLLWVFGLGGGADWAALWPASAVIWQFGNLVPLAVSIPAEYVAVAGLDPAAASFVLSLAPLAFASFTVIFAARSGVRASQADAWLTGVIAGSVVVAVLSALVALTSVNDVAAVALWQAVLFPTILFAVPAVAAAVVTEWREAGAGVVARARDRVEAAPHGWAEAPGLIARGTAVVVAGLVGLGALLIAVALVLRGGEIIALYEAAHLDVLGVIVVTIGQLAYLPTLVVWSIAFIAGPGFAVGAGASVSPAGTQVGVVPGIPILGIIPDSTTPWLLLLALGPIALGALAGWIARSRLTGVGAPRPAAVGSSAVPTTTDAMTDPDRTSALAGLLALSAADRVSDEPAEAERESAAPTAPRPDAEPEGDEPIGARLVVLLGVAVLSAAAAALLAAAASGSFGPGRLAVMGPSAGPLALAVGLEVILGAGILLLSPRGRRRQAAPADIPAAAVPDVASPTDADADPSAAGTAAVPDEAEEGLRTEDAAPREPFSFPTLPRIPDGPRTPGEGGGTAPVD